MWYDRLVGEADSVVMEEYVMYGQKEQGQKTTLFKLKSTNALLVSSRFLQN